jgi:hypothetical protein
MIYRLEKDFVSGSYTYDMEELGLITMDRMQGTFIVGFILFNDMQTFDVFDNPYISVKAGRAKSGWKVFPNDAISLRQCTEDEAVALRGKYWYDL